MSNKWCIITTLIAALLAVSSITATEDLAYNVDEKAPSYIVVDPSRRGGFTTIQAAINAVPSNNQRWTTINIKPGVYREQVLIPQDKPFIFLKGAGMRSTSIVWDGHLNISLATFSSEASNTLAKDITFINSYNYPPNTTHHPRVQAVAARILGDKSAFYQCGFFGVQDTLWDAVGRHLYKNCIIEGAVDFIFGAGQSHYEGCVISVPSGASGYITAQGRESAHDTNGFVFKNCYIVGKGRGRGRGRGRAYLGRAWKKYARVVYYKTQMSDIIVPRGWDAWNLNGLEKQPMFAEYDCSGPGAKKSGRVGWEKTLSREEVSWYTNVSYIDDGGWVANALSIMGAQ